MTPELFTLAEISGALQRLEHVHVLQHLCASTLMIYSKIKSNHIDFNAETINTLFFMLIMLCRFVFAFWWSIFVWGVWSHLRQPMHVWTVDRHEAKTVSVTATLRPIEFANVSVLWLDRLKDSVHLELRQTLAASAGDVGIDNAHMFVFEDSFRDTVMETYPIAFANVSIEDAHLDLLQDDIHLSPFRRIQIQPKMTWALGSADVPDLERVGYFKDGKWYEGSDPTQIGFGALCAWCIGVIFLVVMRRRSSTGTVVVKRKKRIFKQQSYDTYP